MKVIDKSNREKLLDFLVLPNDIRKYDKDKQYTIIHEKIEVLEKSFFIDDSIIEYSDYVPSKRQDATWQNALRNFQSKDYLNAYFEILDYIDDYGNRENRNLFESEMNNIKSILRGINKKIKEIINFDNEKEEIKLNGNTNFNLYLVDGSMVDDDKRITIDIENDNIEIFWNGKEIKKQDLQIVSNIRKIVSKYENEINVFAEILEGVKYTGTVFDNLKIVVNNKEYEIDGMTNNEDKKEFYNNLKNELYSYIKKLIDNNTEVMQEIEVNVETNKSVKDMYNNTKKNINTNIEKDINEKYYGISGIISIKNILIH